MNYIDFFQQATAKSFKPYPYQHALAVDLDMPILLQIPTGAGKTEAAILGWLYKQFGHPDSRVRISTPRRLVYCLPTRTLVEQTVDRVAGWCANLDLNGNVDVVTLMGGESPVQWYLHPEKPCILIGTQDMLLSRALNRGYGSSPFMWPVEYGLLNNDCQWVMDEVQLMSNGLPTSTQLAGLRRRLSTIGPAYTMWMSATVDPDWLETIDHHKPTQRQCMKLGPADLSDPSLMQRFHARKIITEAEGLSNVPGKRYSRLMAEFIADRHVPGTLTLVILNRVERAQAVYQDLHDARRVKIDAEKLLIHSRFRASDRKSKSEVLQRRIDPNASGLVVVATQAVEAGVDVSARTLITELASLPSMVQRFGRCNREGEYKEGRVIWVDRGERSQDTAPYEPEEVEEARQCLKRLQGQSVGPADLREWPPLAHPEPRLVIRQRDVLGLFDTMPDLSGSYVDVSQYVRGIDARDVSVFWREIPPEGRPDKTMSKPHHGEIVGVPIGDYKSGPKGVRDFLSEDQRVAWVWDILDGQWRQIRTADIYPGMTLMLDARQGGYSQDTGWNPVDRKPVPEIKHDLVLEAEDGQSSDLGSTSRRSWVSLADHTRHVESEVVQILEGISNMVEPHIREAVMLAARYHDVGKAHPAFQGMLNQGSARPANDVLWAKSPNRGQHKRSHFRHELGSALVILQHATGRGETVCELAAYLAAAHHGKVRLSIRSLPGTRRFSTDSHPSPEYLLGYRIVDPERLPKIEWDEENGLGETVLDMAITEIGIGPTGNRSWLERSLDLLDLLGPFRLAYLEAVLRAGDMRASKKENEESAHLDITE